MMHTSQICVFSCICFVSFGPVSCFSFLSNGQIYALWKRKYCYIISLSSFYSVILQRTYMNDSKLIMAHYLVLNSIIQFLIHVFSALYMLCTWFIIIQGYEFPVFLVFSFLVHNQGVVNMRFQLCHNVQSCSRALMLMSSCKKCPTYQRFLNYDFILVYD